MDSTCDVKSKKKMSSGNSAMDNITLIVNSSLTNSNVMEYLGPGFRTRMSEKTAKDSVILPSSSVAVLLIFVDRLDIFKRPKKEDGEKGESEWKTEKEEAEEKERTAPLESYEQLLERLEKFHQNHQKAVMVVVHHSFGEMTLKFISKLVLHFAPFSPDFIMAHGPPQAASIIRNLAKATHIEAKKIVQKRISKVVEKTCARQPYELNFSEECKPLTNIYMSKVMKLSSSSVEEIEEKFGFNPQTSQEIFNFFNDIIQ